MTADEKKQTTLRVKYFCYLLAADRLFFELGLRREIDYIALFG